MAVIKEFSEFEVKELGIKFAGSEAYKTIACIGSCEEEMDSKVVTKKCRGIVIKKKVKGTGTGKVKISVHCPYDIFDEFYGMDVANLIEGVKAYGSNSTHKEFSVVEKVVNEDDLVKFKAYPNCVLESGIVRKVENGAEEVAEIEFEFAVMPDADGNGLYEALEADLKESSAKTTWMTAWTPELVKAPAL